MLEAPTTANATISSRAGNDTLTPFVAMAGA
jgi:hypothetical protein